MRATVPDDIEMSVPSAQVNTSEQVVQSILVLTTREFRRAYKLIKKVAKNKLEFERLFTVPPSEQHPFLMRIDFISIGSDQTSLLEYSHRKYVMAAEGKVRSLIAALDCLGLSSGVNFRPYPKLELAQGDSFVAELQ